MDMELFKELVPILTTLVGGLIGYLSASNIWSRQQAERRRNISQGILFEIQSLEKMLTGWVNILNAPPGGGNVRINSPLYPAHGLYYVLQKDLFSFHLGLSGALFQFYLRLIDAERLRLHPPNDPAFAIMQDGVRAALSEAVNQLPELKRLLQGELGRGRATPRKPGSNTKDSHTA